MKRGHLAAIVVTSCAAMTAARAEEPVAYFRANGADQIIVTASGREQFVDQVAASIGLVSGDEVEALGALRIGEVAGAIPGVFFAGLNGPREIALIRQPLAFDNRTLFLEDGVPLQSSVFFDQSALAYSIALASPGGVEVLRGPGTALHGSDAFSGVVHVRSKPAPESFEARLKARAGEFGLFDFTAEAGGPVLETHKLRLTASVSGEDGFREETAFDRRQIIGRHDYGVGVFSAETLGVFTRYETESATAIPYDDFLAGSRASGLSALIDPEAAVERGLYARLQSKLAWRLSKALSFEVTPYYRTQNVRSTATFQPATAPRTEADVTSLGALPRAYWSHDRGASTVLGLDLEQTAFDRLTVQDAPDTIVFGDLFRQGVQFDYEVDYRGVSPFVQHERTFNDLTLTLGLRYDDLRYDFDNALEEVPGDARFQSSDRTDTFDALSPKASLVWRLSDQQSVFARYARGFRIPRESDLYELEEGQAEFTLDPETLDSGELGWRGNWRSGGVELVGYWAESQDGAITDVQTAAGNITINAGSTRYRGIEASGRWALSDTLNADMAFAYQDFRFIRRAANGPDPFDGNLVAEAPRTLGHVALNWRPASAPRSGLTARLRHIGEWALDDANTRFTDNEFILTVLGEWRLSETVMLDARLENATDEIYAVFADAPVFRPAGRARPGARRTFSIGVTAEF